VPEVYTARGADFLERHDYALYRFYDDDDQLLYVGKTHALLARLPEHALTKPWWWSTAFVTVAHFDSAEAVAAAEAHAIDTEHPAHNVQGVETRVPVRRTWTEKIRRQRALEDARTELAMFLTLRHLTAAPLPTEHVEDRVVELPRSWVRKSLQRAAKLGYASKTEPVRTRDVLAKTTTYTPVKWANTYKEFRPRHEDLWAELEESFEDDELESDLDESVPD
jgi:hypothetical protein